MDERAPLKISGTGWLCVWDRDRWQPIFKLTDEQLREWRYANPFTAPSNYLSAD